MMRGSGMVVVLMTVLAACRAGRDDSAGTPAPVAAPEPTPTPTPTLEAPAASPSDGPTVVASPPDRPIPPGSGDYAAVLAEARKYQRGEIEFAALQRWIVARNLPPHARSDVFVIMPVPAPPPGVPYDPMMMPGDWVGTWGEVAMAHFAGALTRDEYDRLHAAAHPMCTP